MPQNYKRKTNRGSWSAECMQAALVAVLEGTMGYRKASKFFSVPQTTLERRVKIAREKLKNPVPSSNSAPCNSTPSNSAPSNSAPSNTAPSNSAPSNSATSNSAPSDSTTSNSATYNSAPSNTAPSNSETSNSVPSNSATSNSATSNSATSNSATSNSATYNSAPSNTAPSNSETSNSVPSTSAPSDSATFHFTANTQKFPLGPKKKVFTESEEQELCDYILEMETRLYGLTLKDLRSLAYSLAVKNNIPHPFDDTTQLAGKGWAKGFLRRFPQLRLRKPENTSAARASGFNKQAVDNFYELLGKIYDENNLTPDRIFNCDETGISVVPKARSKVLAKKGRKQVGSITSADRGTTVTAEICLSAGGQYMPPMLIYPRKRMDQTLMKNASPGAWGVVSDSGWITSEIFLQWFKEFIIFSRATPDRKVLLLLDGHSTHTRNLEVIKEARANGVIILCFPPHTTHRLQVADVAFMRPLSIYYEQQITAWLRSHPGMFVTIRSIAEIFGKAFIQAATMSTAVNGFKKCGIWPYDPSVFSEVDFAPSLTTDIPLVVPQSPSSILEPQDSTSQTTTVESSVICPQPANTNGEQLLMGPQLPTNTCESSQSDSQPTTSQDMGPSLPAPRPTTKKRGRPPLTPRVTQPVAPLPAPPAPTRIQRPPLPTPRLLAGSRGPSLPSPPALTGSRGPEALLPLNGNRGQPPYGSYGFRGPSLPSSRPLTRNREQKPFPTPQAPTGSRGQSLPARPAPTKSTGPPLWEPQPQAELQSYQPHNIFPYGRIWQDPDSTTQLNQGPANTTWQNYEPGYSFGPYTDGHDRTTTSMEYQYLHPPSTQPPIRTEQLSFTPQAPASTEGSHFMETNACPTYDTGYSLWPDSDVRFDTDMELHQLQPLIMSLQPPTQTGELPLLLQASTETIELPQAQNETVDLPGAPTGTVDLPTPTLAPPALTETEEPSWHPRELTGTVDLPQSPIPPPKTADLPLSPLAPTGTVEPIVTTGTVKPSSPPQEPTGTVNLQLPPLATTGTVHQPPPSAPTGTLEMSPPQSSAGTEVPLLPQAPAGTKVPFKGSTRQILAEITPQCSFWPDPNIRSVTPEPTIFPVWSPKQILPIPATVKTSRIIRKRGKTVVITSSPYKSELENQINKKKTDEENKRKKKENREKKTAEKRQKPAKKTKKAKKAKLAQQPADEDSDETDSERDNVPCLYCKGRYLESDEGWAACSVCGTWAHCSCAGVDDEDAEATFTCEFCKQK